MSKTRKIIFYVATALFSAMMMMGATMYFTDYPKVAGVMKVIGFPTYIIYPLAVLKLLGLVAIWTNKSNWLKEWAYAGYTFTFLLAISGHLVAQDGGAGGAVGALVLMSVSYILGKKR